jgi:hypothetical protein
MPSNIPEPEHLESVSLYLSSWTNRDRFERQASDHNDKTADGVGGGGDDDDGEFDDGDECPQPESVEQKEEKTDQKAKNTKKGRKRSKLSQEPAASSASPIDEAQRKMQMRIDGINERQRQTDTHQSNLSTDSDSFSFDSFIKGRDA